MSASRASSQFFFSLSTFYSTNYYLQISTTTPYHDNNNKWPPWHVQTHHQNKESKDSKEDEQRGGWAPGMFFSFHFLIFTKYLQVAYTNTTTGTMNTHHHHTSMNDMPNDRRPAQPNNEGCDNNNEWGDEQWQWGGAWDTTHLEAQVCFFYFFFLFF